jgi:hypothetical protein
MATTCARARTFKKMYTIATENIESVTKIKNVIAAPTANAARELTMKTMEVTTARQYIRTFFSEHLPALICKRPARQKASRNLPEMASARTSQMNDELNVSNENHPMCSWLGPVLCMRNSGQ